MGITIYSTNSCVPCQYLRKYLDGKGIKYTKYFVDEDEEAFERMLSINGGKGTVPTVVIGNNVVVGFNKNLIDGYIEQVKLN